MNMKTFFELGNMKTSKVREMAVLVIFQHYTRRKIFGVFGPAKEGGGGLPNYLNTDVPIYPCPPPYGEGFAEQVHTPQRPHSSAKGGASVEEWSFRDGQASLSVVPTSRMAPLDSSTLNTLWHTGHG